MSCLSFGHSLIFPPRLHITAYEILGGVCANFQFVAGAITLMGNTDLEELRGVLWRLSVKSCLKLL